MLVLIILVDKVINLLHVLKMCRCRCRDSAALRTRSAPLSFQSAELAEYTSKITLLEEDKKRKVEEVLLWQHKVGVNVTA